MIDQGLTPHRLSYPVCSLQITSQLIQLTIIHTGIGVKAPDYKPEISFKAFHHLTQHLQMSITPVSNTETTTPVKEIGFSVKQGVNWSNYLAYRPQYPASFFHRIYDYHSQKPKAAWSVAHDIGAGCGIVSSSLAPRFDSVIVSDPNDGYVTLARKILVDELSIPEPKFRFLKEGAEKSSVKTGTVDLVAVCECIHWTDTDAAIQEFGRELKAGGTLAITHYTVPLIAGNDRAQSAWKAIWDAYSERARDESFDHAFTTVNTGYDRLEFPEEEWDAIKRIYINARGTVEAFLINDRVRESRVKAKEEKIWVEDDADWMDEQGIDWFKGYLATWVPRIPESEIGNLWGELELALGGKRVKIETPVAMVFAPKNA